MQLEQRRSLALLWKIARESRKNESPRVNSYPVFLCISLPLSLVLPFYLSLFLPPFLTSLATIISLSALRGERHDLFVCLYHPVYMRHYVGCNKASPRCITRTCIIHVYIRDCVNRALKPLRRKLRVRISNTSFLCLLAPLVSISPFFFLSLSSSRLLQCVRARK